jgi:hypothetical protein
MSETQSQNVVADTVKQTVEALAPTILAAGIASNPNTAAIASLAPVALQFLQSATALQQAGALSPEQLAYMFSSMGQGIQTTHDKWAAMDVADAAALAAGKKTESFKT